MPKTDVPPPGQGKRSQRKAWHDKADQTIAIYGLTAAEAPEPTAIEDLEVMSHMLPYWDDALQPQPQSQSRSNIYTEEEVQEQVERAYQEGWQQGMEDGYKLGRDKGYKEYMVQQVQEEEEAKKAKKQANEGTTVCWDTQSTTNIISRVNASTQTVPAAPKACTSAKSTHNTSSSSISVNTSNWHPKSLLATSRDATSSISLTASPPKPQIIEIVEIDHQAVPGDTCFSILENTVTNGRKTLTAVPWNATSSITPSNSSTARQIVETDHLATYDTSTSSDTIQTAHLHNENTSDDVYDSYVVISDSHITPSRNYNNPEEYHPKNTSISEYTITDTQTDESAVLLVDYDVQSLTPVPKASPDTVNPSKSTYTSMPHHQLPPLPSLQPLSPSPYKRQDMHTTASQFPEAPQNEPSASEKPISAHLFTQNGQFCNPTLPNSPDTALLPSEQFSTTSYSPTQLQTTPADSDIVPQIMDSDIPALPPLPPGPPQPGVSANPTNSFPPVPAFRYPTTSSSATPTIIIHAQTVIINNTASSHIPTDLTQETIRVDNKYNAPPKRTSTRITEDPAMPPRNLSVLRSHCHHPFSSLRRRSRRRRQSMPVGFNWDSNLHHGYFSRVPPVY
jgi:hypothetical protein